MHIGGSLLLHMFLSILMKGGSTERCKGLMHKDMATVRKHANLVEVHKCCGAALT